MARIDTYAKDKALTMKDKILGTNGDDNNKTVNFPVFSLIGLVNESLGNSPIYFKYSLGDGPSYSTPGYFFSNGGDSMSQTTELVINKQTQSGVDISGFLECLVAYKDVLSLAIKNPGDPNNFAYFTIKGYENSTSHVILDVEVTNGVTAGLFKDEEVYGLWLDMTAAGGTNTVVQDNKTKILELNDFVTRTITNSNIEVNKSVAEIANNMSFTVAEDENLYVKGQVYDTYNVSTPEVLTATAKMLNFSYALWRFNKGKGNYASPNSFTNDDFELIHIEKKQKIYVAPPSLSGPDIVTTYTGFYPVKNEPQGFFNSTTKTISEGELTLVAPIIKEEGTTYELWEFQGEPGVYGPGQKQSSYTDFKKREPEEKVDVGQNNVIVPIQISALETNKTIVEVFQEKHPYSPDAEQNAKNAFTVYPAEIYVITKKEIEKKGDSVYQTKIVYTWNKGEGVFVEGGGQSFKSSDFTEISRTSTLIASDIGSTDLVLHEVVAETPTDVENPYNLLNGTGENYDLTGNSEHYFDVVNPVKRETYHFVGAKQLYSPSNPFTENDFELVSETGSMLPTLQAIVDSEPFQSVTFPSGGIIEDMGYGLHITNGAGSSIVISNEGNLDIIDIISNDKLKLKTDKLYLDVNGSETLGENYVLTRQSDSSAKFQKIDDLLPATTPPYNIRTVTSNYSIAEDDDIIICDTQGITISYNPLQQEVGKQIRLVLNESINLSSTYIKYGVETSGSEIPSGQTLDLFWDGDNMVQVN